MAVHPRGLVTAIHEISGLIIQFSPRMRAFCLSPYVLSYPIDSYFLVVFFLLYNHECQVFLNPLFGWTQYIYGFTGKK
jgi:hypothetical protein